MKKVLYTVLSVIFFMLLLTNNVQAVENVTSNKKVVSLAFDDSGSMSGEKQVLCSNAYIWNLEK